MRNKTRSATAKRTTALIAAAMRDLPNRLKCPKCGRRRSKMMFGLRVMKRDANGVPLVIRRQSYCGSCRGLPS